MLGILLMGDRVHVHVDDRALRIPELEARLAAGAVAHAPIETVEASIEDVFVALVGEAA